MLFIVHGVVTLAAATLLAVLPAVIPATVGITIGPQEFLLSYFLAAAELATGVLSLGAVRITDRSAVKLIVVVIIVFHLATAALEIAYLSFTLPRLVLAANIAVRLIAAALFVLAWKTTVRETRMSDNSERTAPVQALLPPPARPPVEPTHRGRQTVTEEPSNPSADTVPSQSARAETLAYQGLANRVVRGLLRTPLLCRVVGARLLTIYVVSRKSGRRYAIPVAYTQHDGVLLVGTTFGWGRNLRTGEAVDIRLKGKKRRASVEVVTDKAGVAENYAVMARDNRQFAKFNQIKVDRSGDPEPADLHLAWTAGARAFRLTPR